MNLRQFAHSLRFRIVLTYCLLVLVATTIVGVFFVGQMQSYYIGSVRTNMTNTATSESLVNSFSASIPIDEHEEEIQANIAEWGKGLSQEMFVVASDFSIVAASNQGNGSSAVDFLDCNIILTAFSGETAESQAILTSGTSEIPVFNMAFPLTDDEGDVIGVLYIREDITAIRDSIAQSKLFFAKAMAIALVITLLLGFIVAKTITGPVNDVTATAKKMAEGDFSQDVEVKSDDEIGQLAAMFNYLRGQLNDTLFEIQSEKNKLETILAQMVDGLIAVDFAGHIIHANEVAMGMLQASEEDLRELSYDDLASPLSPDITLEKLREKCEFEPGSEVFESAGRFYDIRYDIFKDEFGRDSGIVIILQDITQRTKLENMQMDFVANVSHELKTPLTTIKSYTETLLDGALDDRETAESFLGIVDTEADRMNRLVKDLLQLSRMENNQEKWNMAEADLTTLLALSVQKIALMAQAKQQRVNVLFSKDKKVNIIMDKDRIEQVVLNILSNAIKYTQEGGRIDVDLVVQDKEAKVIISDNGIGIPEDEQSRVFERFFRVDKARSRAMGGTGLGLAISKQIVEEHGGHIELQSKEGKGSTFTVSLPLVTVNRGMAGID